MSKIKSLRFISLVVSAQLLCSLSSYSGQKENYYNTSSESVKRGELMLQVGEELEYSVHYALFNIGTIRFKVTDKEERNGRTVYRAYAFMDSNPSISWLKDLHVKFFGEIDQEAFSYGWVSEDSTSKKVTYRKMRFDYEKKKMFFEWGEKLPSGEQKKYGDNSVNINSACQDGLSLFYYARQHVLENRKNRISTFIDTSEFKTNFNFGVENLSEEIDAIDYPVDVVKLDGKLEFEGVFGLTGGFEGVFSNDDAGIPIKASLKVMLGSVRVELRQWKRSNWVPPKASE